MKPFLILGANKSGTSTACAIANTHPDVFCLYDVDFTKDATSGRNQDVAEAFPETRPLFGTKTENISDVLKHVHDALAARGFEYAYLGIKTAGIRPDIYANVCMPTLFVVRDVRTWAAKNRVIVDYIKKSGGNIAPVITSYIGSYILSFLYPHIRRARLEDVFVDATSLPRAVSKLLDLPTGPFLTWWEKSDWTQTVPKNYSRWFDGHRSAFMKPIVSDTNVVLSDHPFWAALLPIFDKYFHRHDQQFDESEIIRDLDIVKSAQGEIVRLDEAYISFHSMKLYAVETPKGEKPKVRADEVIEKRPNESWRTVSSPPTHTKA